VVSGRTTRTRTGQRGKKEYIFFKKGMCAGRNTDTGKRGRAHKKGKGEKGGEKDDVRGGPLSSSVVGRENTSQMSTQKVSNNRGICRQPKERVGRQKGGVSASRTGKTVRSAAGDGKASEVNTQPGESGVDSLTGGNDKPERRKKPHHRKSSGP